MAFSEMSQESFWNGEESHLLLNPRLQKEKQERIRKEIQPYFGRGCVWIKSSGTESSKEDKDKLVKLSKASILLAAQSVNEFYKISKKDIWLNTLPKFHIGGLSIFARSYLSGANVVSLEKWSAQGCFESIEKHKVSLISLVPTQVYDLIQLGEEAPSSLRLVIVGGGALSEKLYGKAKDLGWPVVPSYGMTETCALIAGAELESLKDKQIPDLKILKHVQIEHTDSGHQISSECLFKGYLFVGKKEAQWMPQDGPFKMDDRLELNNGYLKILGRESDLVKILGETVDISALEKKLQELLPKSGVRVAIVARDHERRGYDLEAFIEGEDLGIDMEHFNKEVMPYERISKIIYKKKFPTSELGKIIKNQLI